MLGVSAALLLVVGAGGSKADTACFQGASADYLCELDDGSTISDAALNIFARTNTTFGFQLDVFQGNESVIFYGDGACQSKGKPGKAKIEGDSNRFWLVSTNAYAALAGKFAKRQSIIKKGQFFAVTAPGNSTFNTGSYVLQCEE